MTDRHLKTREALRRLLDALDGHDPARIQRMGERPRDGQLFGAFEERGLGDLDVALALSVLRARLAGDPSVMATTWREWWRTTAPRGSKRWSASPETRPS